MEDTGSLPESQGGAMTNPPENGGEIPHPSAPLSIQLYNYTAALNHAQQPLSYSLYHTNPIYGYSQYSFAPTVSEPGLQGPYAPQDGVAGYAIAAAPQPYAGAGPLDAAPYASSAVVGGTAGVAYDYGGADLRTLAWKDAIRLYRGHPSCYFADPNSYNGEGLGTTLPLYSNPPYQEVAKQKKFKKNKQKKKITKIVQSAYCEVCKVDCNSQDVLNTHKQGQKHKKNLQKLQKSITPIPAKASPNASSRTAEIVGEDNENLERNENNRKRIGESVEDDDLGTKKIKLIEEGAKAAGVRACTVCNIVVNSLKVYESHVAGQKHTAMVEKLQERSFVDPNSYNGEALGTSLPLPSNPPHQEMPKQQKIKKNKKKKKKITKVVQSAFCEVCKVGCNSQDVLNSHKQGQKHKKNLQKLQKSITPSPAIASPDASSRMAEIAGEDEENLERNANKRKRTCESKKDVDLEMKKIKLVEAGAKADGVRACTICNIAVNSLKVYESHLAGQKHAAMVEKLQ